MTKIIRLFFLLLFLCPMAFVNGQSFSLGSHPDTVEGYYDGTKDLEVIFDVYNNSSSTKKVYSRRRVVYEVSGSENQFCWGATCYPPFVDTSQSTRTIQGGGGVDSSFIAYYDPKGYPGTTKVEYCFYDSLDPGDSVCTMITFDASNSVGIQENQGREKTFRILTSNPVQNDLKIGYELHDGKDAKLVLHNMLGAEVKEVTISGGREMILNTSGLKSGVYFATVVSAGERVGTQKVVIDH